MSDAPLEDPANKDAIPLESVFLVSGPTENDMMTASFYSFNTSITLQAFGDEGSCRAAFAQAEQTCRMFERLLSRTLPHSAISRINAAKGNPVEIDAITYDVLSKSLFYCEQSRGCFDITIGSAVRLWNFHESILPDQEALSEALTHINWRTLQLSHEESSQKYFAQLADSLASVDVGGTAKGYIADVLAEGFAQFELTGYIINLGGNVVVRGVKPDGSSWRVGLQDPRAKGGIVGAIELTEGSAVTSGIYERCFERDGALYHHILDPQTGFPAQTDVRGVTVVAEKSLDAEGFSTTLLALGMAAGLAFAANRPEISQAYFINESGQIITAK